MCRTANSSAVYHIHVKLCSGFIAIALLAPAQDFDRTIKPLLEQRCLRCHAGDKPAAGFDMTAGLANVLKPGDPDSSKLYQHLASGKMPMGGPRFEAGDLAAVANWIRAGAVENSKLTAPKKVYWAFQPPVKSPAGRSIDDFLLAKLKGKDLGFSPLASSRDLIRRLHFALTGLPPKDDDYQLGYEETINKLLASPAYGERWGRHWLDVVRFGESDGGEHNFERFHAWRYRDYVIDALNADKPYSQFVREQLTGDLLAPDDPKMVAATGFLVAGPWDSVSAELNKDAAMKKTARMDELDDMVTTTFHTFQALTVNCARCHDHKFDPIPTKEYYQLTSVFGGVGFGTRQVVTAEDKKRYEAEVKPFNTELAKVQRAIDEIELPVKSRLLRDKMIAYDRQRANEEFRLPLTPVFSRNRFAPINAKHLRIAIQGHQGKLARIDALELQPAGIALGNWTAPAAASADKPVYVTLDNPAAKTVSAIEWSTDRTNGRNDGMIKVYALEASDDGATWRTIAVSLDHISVNEIDMPVVADAEMLAALSTETRERRAGLLQDRAEWRKKIDAIAPPAMVYAAKPHPIEPAHLLERGSVSKAKEEVFPGALSALPHRSALFGLDGKANDAPRRIALADWITDSRNPLTARVIVNRVWYFHFGNGIVNTPSDFGLMGDRPSHQELLDWLAVSFMENGWSLKWLHRQIVSSKAYQQASAMNEKAFAIDADNRLLWRMPLKRMDAETLRDSILSATASLNPARGGPSFLLQKKGDRGSYIYAALDNDGPDVWKRAVYRFVVRGGERIFMDSFDCPDPSVATPQRSISNTPVQALTLLNNGFVMKQSERFAARLSNEAQTPEARIKRAYQILYGREPSPNELDRGLTFSRQHGMPAYARVLFNTNEFIYTP
jgi:mono/diheme cytochrome c family protein